MAAARRRFRGRVAQQIILALLTSDFFQARHQVVGVQYGESARAGGQCVHHLLIGGRVLRKLRNNLARRIVGRVAVRAADNGPAASTCAASRTTFTAAGATASATSRPAFAATCATASCAATPAVTATAPGAATAAVTASASRAATTAAVLRRH